MMILVALGLVLTATDVRAQDPATSNPDQVGPYSVTSSVEVGVRGVKIEGDQDKYRSDLNYQPGFQFLDSSFYLKADEPGQPVFDSLLVRVTGWDSDPSGYLRVDAEKLDWYRLNTTVRRFNYFNALKNLALKQHRDDTEHTIGDVNLVVLPQSRKFRANFDYSWDRNNGVTLSTYDFSRDEFPIFAPLKTKSDTFTGGFDATAGKVDFSFAQGYRRYRDDATFFINTPQQGNDGVVVPSFLNTFERDLPTRGSVTFTRASLHTFLNDTVDVTGRFVYSKSKTDSTLFETISGADFTATPIDLYQASSLANSERPNVLADIGVSVLATDQLTISNTFRYNWFKIEGAQNLSETTRTPRGTSMLDRTFTRLTRYRQFSNLTEIDYQFDPRISAHIGYRYTDRSTTLEALDLAEGAPDVDPEVEDFDNRTNTFIFGVKAKPIKHHWTLFFDFERGESDNVFTRVANYNYTSIRLRNRINITDELSLNLSATARDNENPAMTEDIPPVDFGANTESRSISASADWTPNRKLVLSAGYAHARVTTDTQIIFFFNFQRKNGLSEYFSRDNSAYVSASAQIHPRVALYGSYRFHNDTGAGDRVAPSADVLISQYPYRYQTPEVRCSIRLHDRLDLNVGYQYTKFEERFRNLTTPEHLSRIQDYSAHLPYASLRFYFGRRE